MNQNINFQPHPMANVTPHRIEDGSVIYRYLNWRGSEYQNMIVSSDGDIFRPDGKLVSSHIVNGRKYVAVDFIDNKRMEVRIDYIVAYTYLGMINDAIRLVHINELLNDNRVSNLKWVRKCEIEQKYIEMGIINQDGIVTEKWAPCRTEYSPDLGYQVSNLGRVIKADGTPVNVVIQNGYKVFFYLDRHNKNTRCKMVHIAVAEAFLPNPNPEKYNVVNHIDGNKSNAAVYNLEWVTLGDNTEHAYITGLHQSHANEIDKIYQVCSLLQEGKLSHVEIAEKTGINVKTVSDIYRGHRWADVSKDFNFPGKRWTPEIKERIAIMISKGFQGRQIADALHTDYDQPFISLYERTRRKLKADGLI